MYVIFFSSLFIIQSFVSENANDEYNKSYSSLSEAKRFLDEHPDFEFPILNNRRTNVEIPIDELYGNIENSALYQNGGKPNPAGVSPSNFRHKAPGEGLIRDFSKTDFTKNQPHGSPQHIHIQVCVHIYTQIYRIKS